MTSSSKTFSSLLFLSLSLSISVFSTACVSDEIGASQAHIDARPFFEMFEGEDGDTYFNLAAANHEIVLSSEGYRSRTGALSGILSVLDNGGEIENFDLREAVNGQYYFLLKAANGKTIGRSELYSSKGNAKRGIKSTSNTVDDYLGFLNTRKGARFTVFESDSGQYYFNLKANNGKIVLQSQAYGSEAAAMNGTFAVAKAGMSESNYVFKTAKDGSAYFTLRAANHEVVGTSEMYSSKSNARKGCEGIVAFLPEVTLL